MILVNDHSSNDALRFASNQQRITGSDLTFEIHYIYLELRIK